MRVNIGFPMVRTDGRAYGHVITKFSRMGRLPHFLSYGAPSTCALRARVELRYNFLWLVIGLMTVQCSVPMATLKLSESFLLTVKQEQLSVKIEEYTSVLYINENLAVLALPRWGKLLL